MLLVCFIQYFIDSIARCFFHFNNQVAILHSARELIHNSPPASHNKIWLLRTWKISDEILEWKYLLIVCREIEGRIYVGIVKEKGAAEEQYNTAVSQVGNYVLFKVADEYVTVQQWSSTFSPQSPLYRKLIWKSPVPMILVLSEMSFWFENISANEVWTGDLGSTKRKNKTNANVFVQ